jgi:biopolymer transport protein TolR
MAFNFNDDDDLGALADINVTPLVDVMLVLLIIFMVTAPLLTQGLEVELPKAEGKNFETTSNKPATITIASSGAVMIDGDRVGSTDLEITLGTALRGRQIRRALLEADQSVPYGKVIQVIDIMNRAGVEQLGMMTRPREGGDEGRGR